MSESEVHKGSEAAINNLERQTNALLDRLEELREALDIECSRTKTLEAMISSAEADGEHPGVLIDRMDQIRRRNEDLEHRLAKGRAAAERLIARVRFLENQS